MYNRLTTFRLNCDENLKQMFKKTSRLLFSAWALLYMENYGKPVIKIILYIF